MATSKEILEAALKNAEYILKLERMLESIVTDVNAMKQRDDEYALQFTGAFKDDDYVVVSWPNLDILIKEAEKLLKGQS